MRANFVFDIWNEFGLYEGRFEYFAQSSTEAERIIKETFEYPPSRIEYKGMKLGEFFFRGR